MATTQEAVKLKKGDAVKFNSRNIDGWKGKGTFVRYEGSGRGQWVIVNSESHGREIALRESQVKLSASKSAAPKPDAAAKTGKASGTPKTKTAKAEEAPATPAA